MLYPKNKCLQFVSNHLVNTNSKWHARGEKKKMNRGMFSCQVHIVLVWNKHALSVLKHALGLFSDPGPVESRTGWDTLCAVTAVDLTFSQLKLLLYHPSTEHFVGCNRGTCSFFSFRITSACMFPPKLLLGDCWGWDCAFFWMDFVVHDATPTLLCDVHQTAYGSVSDSSVNRALCTELTVLPFEW